MIVETGEGEEGANSLVDEEFADDYFSERSNFNWDAVDKESALVRATTYVLAKYRGQWPGVRTSGRVQSLDWPRTGAYDAEGEEIADDEIPVELKQAICEAALLEGQTPGALSPTISGPVIKSQKLGELQIDYDTTRGGAESRPNVTIIDDLLGPLIASAQDTGSSAFIQRA